MTSRPGMRKARRRSGRDAARAQARSRQPRPASDAQLSAPEDHERFLPLTLRRRARPNLPDRDWGRACAGAPEQSSRVGGTPGRGGDAQTPLRRFVAMVTSWLWHSYTALVHRWRRSIQFRMVGLAISLSVVAALVVGVVVAGQVRDRLLDARRTQVDQEAARRGQLFQDLIDASTATTADDVEQVVRDALSRITSTGGPDPTGVVLLRSPSRAQPVVPAGFAQGTLDVAVIPTDLREAVQDSANRQIRSISVTDSQTGSQLPGLIVGQQVRVPLGGSYELYLVTSLEAEQRTLSLIQRGVALGLVILVGMLGLVSYALARMVVIPVREAALASERLAAGELSERLPVRGEDELATLARSFNEMAAGLQSQISQLEELSRVQQRFVSDVSHELRTPLTTMRMAGEVIYDARADLDPAASRSAELLNAQLDRFDALLADLLEISRIDAGAAALAAESIDLRTLTRHVVHNVQPLAERNEVAVRLHLPDEPVTAEIDPRRIERVLRNLVDNAIEHSEGLPVDIWLARDDDVAAVLVRDYGIGLTGEDAARVFDKFWRADPARARTTGGTGLGLAIAAEDTRLHGGRLDVWGEPGQGAAFRLTVPVCAGAAMHRSPLPLGPQVPE